MTDRDAVVRELHDEQCHWMPRCTLSICDLYPLLKRAFEAGQAHEKEACVKVADDWLNTVACGEAKEAMEVCVERLRERGAHHTKGEGK